MPAPPDDPIHVHSVQEEYFYMMVHRCECGGPWTGQPPPAEAGPAASSASPGVDVRPVRCFKCAREHTFRFQLDTRVGPKDPVRQVNPTAEPSRALDAAEWLDLAQFYLDRIARLKAPTEKAQSLLDARQCLEEALKFYGPQDEEPPAAALWSDASRRKASRQAGAYRRSTILAMLERIPPLDRLRKADSLEQKEFEKAVRLRARERVGRKWWQFWKLWQEKAG